MTKKILINDGRTQSERFAFSFVGTWAYDSNYFNRFEGGDEHWTTAAIHGDVLPSFSLHFVGHAVSLYGHKVPCGAMAAVSIDGKDVGVLDYYAPSRQEKALLFSAENLEEDEHILTVALLNEANPAASAGREASIDYAEICCDHASIPPEGLEFTERELYLEDGLTAAVHCRIFPDFATDDAVIVYSTSNPRVAIVSPEGVVTGTGAGQAVITASLQGYDISAQLEVTCGAACDDFCGTIGEDDIHTMPDEYFQNLQQCRKNGINIWSGSAFRRDVVLAKIDLFSKSKTVNKIKCSLSDWKSADGKRADIVCDLQKISPTFAHDTGRLVPDCLYSHCLESDNEGFFMAKQEVRTLFARMEIPEDIEPEVYTAQLTITAEDVSPLVFTLNVEVLPLTLTAPSERESQLELWMYPYSAERYYSGKSTEEYFSGGLENLPFTHLTGKADEALRSQLKLYAEAGGRAITTTCVEDPWNHQTHDPYPSMIKWHHHEGDTFTFDYTDFDRWVQMNMDCGVCGQIKVFSIAAWGNRITYINDDGSVATESPVPGSDRWKTLWGTFIHDLQKHTLEKGWFELTYLAMDEREREEILAVLDLNDSIRTEDGRRLKTSIAVFRFDAEDLFDRLDDLSLALQMDASKVEEIARRRREAGLMTTMYTCGAQCSALSNQPYESEYSILYTAKLHTDGFLRWALDSFNADPVASSAHRLFAAGDLYMIYPSAPINDRRQPGEDLQFSSMEARTSHRYEKLAAGLRDVEKIRILRKILPDYADTLHRLLDSLGTKGDRRSEVKRIMDAVYSIARSL